MNALLSLVPLLAPQKARLARALLLSLTTLAAGVALLGLSGWFLTAAALSTAGVAFNLFGPSAGVRGLAFIRILSRYGERVDGHDATLRLLSDIRGWLFARLFDAIPLPGAGLSRPDLVNRMVADVDALDVAFLTAIGPITTAIAVGLAMTLGLAVLLPGAALGYGACFLGVALIIPAALVLVSRDAGTAVVSASAELRRAVLDGLDGHRDLVVFGQLGPALARTAGAAAQLASTQRRIGVLGAGANAVMLVLAGTAAAFVLLSGIAAFNGSRIDGPMLAALLFLVIASFEAAAPLVRGATRLARAAAAAERLRAVAGLKSTIAAGAHAAVTPAGGALELERIRFGYDPARPVLRELSLSIATGGRIAIVGPSGAGKSTIAQLLVRLADPQFGSIRLNGVDTTQLSLADLRRHIALMTQDAPVFNDSLRNNLLVGRSDANDAALWGCLEAARLADFVRSLPHQLDTIVGEAGSTLSSGQVRRLALARTLLSPAEILVLDEPTSGLDRDTEMAFFESLRDVAEGRTVIVITHASIPAGVVDRTFRLREGSLEVVDAAVSGHAA